MDTKKGDIDVFVCTLARVPEKGVVCCKVALSHAVTFTFDFRFSASAACVFYAWVGTSVISKNFVRAS